MAMNIAIVEDHDGIRLALEMLLEFEGYNVISFDRGELALEHLSAHPADLVLLDLNTNGISPQEFMKTFKERFDGRSLAVGVLSAHPYVKTEAERLGADFWVLKPFDQNVLLNKITETVARKQSELRPTA